MTGLDSVVVVGAGVAGMRAAEALRSAGYSGALRLVGAEPDLPYDRTPLSKEVLTGARAVETTIFHPERHYADLDVELVLGSRVTGLDLVGRRVEIGSAHIGFDGLILAAGARPRTLPVPEGLAGVHVLRTLDDARALRRALLPRPRVVVVGAGFIGAEVASSARALGLQVTVVETEPVPLTRVLGPSMGAACAGLLADHGVRLLTGVGVAAIEGTRQVERVRLTDGRTIEADLVVAGIGVRPDTDWLAGSGLRLGDGVVCDETLAAGPDGVYAAGDLARWPDPLAGGPTRCEQWTNAVEQGIHAARNLLRGRGNAVAFRGSHYFWSDQFGVRTQFAGRATGEVEVVDGDPAEYRFVAHYRDGDRIAGVLAMNAAKAFVRSRLLIGTPAVPAAAGTDPGP